MSSRWSKVALAAVVVTFAVVAVVHAQSGGSTIRGCVDANGNLSILSDPTGYSRGSSCPPGHELDWNQQGPAGPAGATGATGPQGPSGGSAQRNFVVTTDTGNRKVTDHATEFIASAQCPDGHQATGGGYSVHGTAVLIDQDYVVFNGPDFHGSVGSTIGTASGWVVHLIQSTRGPGTAGVTVYAVCAGDPPPGFGATPNTSKVKAKVARKLVVSPKLTSRRVIRVP
jgi:hypothetical protein